MIKIDSLLILYYLMDASHISHLTYLKIYDRLAKNNERTLK